MSKFWKINMGGSDKAEIYLYGYIDAYDVSSGDFIRELRQLEKEYSKIDVRINSGGGDVFEGLAIHNAMINSKAHIETFVDGFAGSMASILMLSGKKCHISKNAIVMTHNPSSGCYGNSEEHKRNAELLDTLEETMLSIYSAKTGKSKKECKEKFMNGKDNWFNAQEAKDLGLVDSIYDNPAVETPKEKKDAKAVWEMYSLQSFAAVFTEKNTDMNKVFISPAVMTAIGLADNADQPTADAAIGALVAKAAKVDTLTAELNTANAAKAKAEKDLEDEKAKTANAEVDTLADAAVVEKRITAEAAKALKVQFAGKPSELKALLATFQPYQSVVATLNGSQKNAAELLTKSYDELDKTNKLEALKAADPAAFYEKYEGKFGKKHKDDPSNK